MAHVVIYEGGAQTIKTIALDENNEPKVPSVATYAIVNLRYHEDDASRTVVAAGTAATIDSASTTTDASSGRGTADPRKVSVADVTGFAEGSQYLITASNGRAEIFRVDHIDTSGNDLYADSELAALYASGSTVTGIEVSATFPSAEAADENEFDDDVRYAIDWTFTGVTPTRARELIQVRRTAQRVYATIEDVRTIDASLAPYTEDRLKLERVLVQAHRDFRRRIRAHGIDPDRYYGDETARDAIAYRAAEIARRQMGGDRDERLADDYGEEYRSIMVQLGGTDQLHTTREGDDSTLDVAHRLGAFGLT